jgi:hypothetical protein
MSVVSVLAAAVSVTVLPATAAADIGLGTTCLGTVSSKYNPGLRNDPRSIDAKIEHRYEFCTGLVVSGVSSASGTSTTSCTDLTMPLEQVPTGGSITWATLGGGTAVTVYSGLATREKVNANIVAVVRGRVTAGMFAGYHFLSQTTYPNVDLSACSTPQGLKELNGIVELIISPLPIL